MHSFKEYLGLNKARIYNLEHRKKPAELVRKDLISAMKLPDHEILNREHYFRILDSWREEWEKGVQVPVNPDSLPKPEVKEFNIYNALRSTEQIFEDFTLLPKLDFLEKSKETPNKSYDLPKKHIEHEESLEKSSCYELDLQDICWLDALNVSDLSIQISDNLLEDVVNEFEQQCARNIKEKQIGIEYDNDTRCDVCQSPDSEENNEMVFCELCNICVHQSCYGILDIPFGDWICNSCRDSGSKKSVICVLCPNVGGALKPTTKANKWAHVCCALWIPEVKFTNFSLMEPIDIRGVLKSRRDLVCSVCNVRKGFTIGCDEPNCKASYHVTCAFKHKLKMDVLADDSNILLKSYCSKHSNSQSNQLKDQNNSLQLNPESSLVSENLNDGISNATNNMLNPLHQFWKYVDVIKVFQEISKKYFNDLSNDQKQKQKIEIVKDCALTPALLQNSIDLIYNYWKLKRISNYGNSLIKLTFAQKFEKEMQFQKSKMIDFRYHLERLRTLSYMLFRREKMKQKWINVQKEIFEKASTLLNATHESGRIQRVASFDKRIINRDNIYQMKTRPIFQKSNLTFSLRNSVESNSTKNCSEPYQVENFESIAPLSSLLSPRATAAIPLKKRKLSRNETTKFDDNVEKEIPNTFRKRVEQSHLTNGDLFIKKEITSISPINDGQLPNHTAQSPTLKRRPLKRNLLETFDHDESLASTALKLASQKTLECNAIHESKSEIEINNVEIRRTYDFRKGTPDAKFKVIVEKLYQKENGRLYANRSPDEDYYCSSFDSSPNGKNNKRELRKLRQANHLSTSASVRREVFNCSGKRNLVSINCDTTAKTNDRLDNFKPNHAPRIRPTIYIHSNERRIKPN